MRVFTDRRTDRQIDGTKNITSTADVDGNNPQPFGFVVTEVCCHKINMNGKEIISSRASVKADGHCLRD